MSQNFFDDFAKMAGGAANAAGGAGAELQNMFTNQMEFMCQKFGLVRKEEIDVLEARIKALEERLETLENA